jgi:hypothetical protein
VLDEPQRFVDALIVFVEERPRIHVAFEHLDAGAVRHCRWVLHVARSTKPPALAQRALDAVFPRVGRTEKVWRIGPTPERRNLNAYGGLFLAIDQALLVSGIGAGEGTTRRELPRGEQLVKHFKCRHPCRGRGTLANQMGRQPRRVAMYQIDLVVVVQFQQPNRIEPCTVVFGNQVDVVKALFAAWDEQQLQAIVRKHSKEKERLMQVASAVVTTLAFSNDLAIVTDDVELVAPATKFDRVRPRMELVAALKAQGQATTPFEVTGALRLRHAIFFHWSFLPVSAAEMTAPCSATHHQD